VAEQAGGQAGDGGYQITVAGKTTLDGAAIVNRSDPTST